MKPTRLFFTAARLPLDYALLLLAAFLTYLIRFESFRTIRPVIYTIPLAEYLSVVVIVAASWIIIFAAHGLYTTRRLGIMEELGKVILGCITGFGMVLLYLVFTQELFSSRFILLGTMLFAIFSVAIGRFVLRGVERLALAEGLGVSSLALIGPAGERNIFKTEFERKPSFGYRTLGEFDSLTTEARQKLIELRRRGKLDGILLANPSPGSGESLEIANLCEDLHIRFFYSADLFAAVSANRTIHAIAGVPVIEIRRAKLDGWGRITKRLFDILLALLLIVASSPLLVLVSVWILIESGLPILFKNERVGEHGRLFDTLKFRTMYQRDCVGKQFPDHAHEALAREQELIRERSLKGGPIYKIKDDPRVTPFGRALRRLSLDELPQLFNVLSGDMSLVGPRPHQPREVEQYARHHRHVLAVKPGITGLAQISGRSDLDFEEENRLDTYYVENWSLTLDLFILAKTPFVVLLRRGAY